ncbi:hypothetical protein VPR01S_21_00920 [Vibrio proteolyticus NBRC 13287]|uniref:DUF721 domain-containing protein n=2 Tax=Vibrionaceae TaxID=641 RepID=U3A6P6_VIBPR|nr:hypothetical protein VPR01S_21_00920 [Vibrio proteolyticus NBRC 13287]
MMRDHRPTSTDTILAKSKMSQLQAHAEEILAINRILQSLLPANAADHCRVANLKDSVLVLEVASAAIKMKLDRDRLHLLNQLRHQGYARLISIEIRINPDLYRVRSVAEEKQSAPPRPPISDCAAAYLRTIAQNAPDKIKQRLENIAKLSRK